MTSRKRNNDSTAHHCDRNCLLRDVAGREALTPEVRQEEREQDAVHKHEERMQPGYDRNERQRSHEASEADGELREKIEQFTENRDGRQGVGFARLKAVLHR